MEKHDAAASLRAAAYPPSRLLAIHSGVMAGVSLVIAAISYILEHAIKPAGGLSAMDLQATLSTIQVMLRLAQLVVMPFWAAGLSYAAIGIARGRRTGPSDLTEGFYRFKPLLTSNLLIAVQYLVRAFISLYLSLQLMVFTPVAHKLYDAAVKLEEEPELGLAALLGQDYVPVMVTYAVIFGVVFLAVCLPVFYRYRLTSYLIMDDQEKGGIRAMLRSRMLMLRRRWDLAKLDLSFWWYYLLLGLGMALSCGDLILAAAGVTLPVPDGVAYWIFLCLGLLVQLAVKILAGPKVAVTYAHRYDRYLKDLPPQRKVKQVDPADLPWTY